MQTAMQAALAVLRRQFELDHSGHHALRPMEGLRGFAVWLVFLVHFITLAEPWLANTGELAEATQALRALGNIGVDLFFVLSGYLIYGMLLPQPRPFLPYMARRIQRIYPTFIVVFLLYVVLALQFPVAGRLPADTGPRLLYLLQNFLLLPGIFEIVPLITVAWSLSYELFFYLAVPLLVGGLGLRRWPAQARIALFLLLAVFILTDPQRVGGHVRFAMFVAGVLVYELESRVKLSKKHWDVLGAAGLLLALASPALVQGLNLGGPVKFSLLALSFLLVCLACFRGQARLARLFSWTPLRWLGNASYSYYLIHGLVLKALFMGLAYWLPPDGATPAVFWWGLPLMFGATLMVAALLFCGIEKPFSLNRRPRPLARATQATRERPL